MIASLHASNSTLITILVVLLIIAVVIYLIGRFR